MIKTTIESSKSLYLLLLARVVLIGESRRSRKRKTPGGEGAEAIVQRGNSPPRSRRRHRQ